MQITKNILLSKSGYLEHAFVALLQPWPCHAVHCRVDKRLVQIHYQRKSPLLNQTLFISLPDLLRDLILTIFTKHRIVPRIILPEVKLSNEKAM